tara:strand:+ start:1472 stop:2224 length:753 start_codon:yes stop_codon:yes gene_type:complete
MSIVTAAGNIYFVYQFIKKLTTPFEKTEAFKLGIIDEKGKVLKKRSSLKSKEEKDAYTLTDTLVFNLKKVLAKIPGGSTRFATFAAALFLLKEEEKKKNLKNYLEEHYLEKKYINFLEECRSKKYEIYEMMDEVDQKEELLEARMKTENIAVGDGSGIHGIGAGPHGEPPGPSKLIKRKKFAGSDVFLVKPEVFMRSRFGKKKYAKYENYVGNDEIGDAIRQYGRSNPGRPIILQDELSGAMLYLRYGKK